MAITPRLPGPRYTMPFASKEGGHTMFRTSLLAMFVFGLAAPSVAAQPDQGQTVKPETPEGAEAVAVDAEALQNATGADQSHWPKIWFQFDLAPEIAQQDPFSSDSRTSDTTDVKWTIGLSHRLYDVVDLDLRLGPVATIDSDRDSTASSRFVGTLQLKTIPLLTNLPPEGSNAASPNTVWNVRTFLKYQAALRYTDFFSDRDGTEHTLDAGVTLQIKFPWADLSLDVAPRRVESTLAGGDYTSFRLAPQVRIPLVREIAIVASGEIERRWYDHVDPLIGRERRDWRRNAFAGVDFSGAINNCLGIELFGEATVGARLIDIDSNVAGEDRSTLKFSGSLRLSVPLTYPMGRPKEAPRCAFGRRGSSAD